MNSIEEQLWNYIDGTCSPQERQAISALIEQNAEYQKKYEELMLLNAELQTMDIEEPPMAFTYNVMETIRTEHAQRPLKAAINNKIINVLAGFFITTIAVLLIYLLATINWHNTQSTSYDVDLARMLSLRKYFTAPVLKIFVFFDVLLALALFDGYMRRKKVANQA